MHNLFGRMAKGSRPWRSGFIAGVAAVAALALVGGGAAMAASWGDPTGARSGALSGALSSASVVVAADDEGLSALAFNRDEERMARDLYTLFSETYDAGPFARIATSEQRHFEAVGQLLSTYDLADPAAGLEPGEYADPVVQGLYDSWETQGLKSLDDAIDVGVALEKRDIADLEQSIATIDKADVDTVLSRLLAGSQQHLRAFTAFDEGTVPARGDGMGRGGHGFGAGGGSGSGPRCDGRFDG